MDSKLRNEKVVDLKKILTGAKITIPAKANKAELIQTILKSKEALAYYETMKADGNGEASSAGTPAPVAATPVGNKAAAGDASTTTAPKDDLLAPLEEFDWTTGQTSAPSESTSTKPVPTPSKAAKPASQTKATPAAVEAVESATKETDTTTAALPLDPEEEAKKRRAERFGTTYVPPKPKPAAKTKPASNATTAKAQVANGKAPTENTEKLKGRAERFGLSTKLKETAITGQKRSAPVDPEEEERRRKRAERFGLPVAKPAPANVPVEEDEMKRKRAERFGLAAK